MSIEEPKILTDEQIADIKRGPENERQLIKQGAEYVPDKDGNLKLEKTKEQLEKIEGKMESGSKKSV
jgi:hypothetical protein